MRQGLLVRLRSYAALLITLVLSGCGYHLAGQGAGAVPERIEAVRLLPVGGNAESMVSRLLQKLAQQDVHYAVYAAKAEIPETARMAELRVENVSENFVPVAYDASGIAIQYQLTFSGSLTLVESGKVIWRSGAIMVQGEVYSGGDPLSLEASRARVTTDLSEQWLNEAILKLGSGF